MLRVERRSFLNVSSTLAEIATTRDSDDLDACDEMDQLDCS